MRPTRAFVLAGCGVALTAAVALAQRVDPRRASTFIIGQAAGPEPTVRGDAKRDGLARAALPRGPLRVEWRYATGGGQIEQPPVLSPEAIIVVTTRGDVVWVPHDASQGHAELARQSVGIVGAASSPPALLSDGTVVVVGGSGTALAVGVDKNGLRFRTQLSGNVSGTELDSVAPLALDDGGVVVATTREIALLDSAGDVRVRAPLPEPLVGPLLATGGSPAASRRILGVSQSGLVYSWSPGGSGGLDVTRVGSFQQSPQSHVQGGAVLSSNDTLVAVVDDRRLMTLDVRQGLAVPLATFPNGGFLGPVAFRRGVTYAMAGVPGHTFAVGVAASGREVLRVPISSSPVLTADGGPPRFSVSPHVPVVVDGTGALAFASPDGRVGVVDPAGIVSALDGVCVRPLRGGRGVTSLVPGGPGAIVVTCVNGTVVRIVHGAPDSP